MILMVQGDGDGASMEVWRYAREVILEGLNLGHGTCLEPAIMSAMSV